MTMKLIFMGRKAAACAALQIAYDGGSEILVVAGKQGGEELEAGEHEVFLLAKKLELEICTEDLLNEMLADTKNGRRTSLNTVDYLICIQYGRKIKREIVELPIRGSINFHPAPLPAYRGWGTYNVGILEGATRWATSAHYMTDHIDAGPIIDTEWFQIDPGRITAADLEQITTQHLISQFGRLYVGMTSRSLPLPQEQGAGRTFYRAEVLAMKNVTDQDTEDTIQKKIRAFWRPPYPGAQVLIDGRNYTLVNEEILTRLCT